jgi:voltage-gated potassium channel
VVDLPAAARTAFTVADLVLWVAFGVDYGARLYLAPARWRFVRTHPLDLLVLVPPVLRPLRALRLARLGALAGVAHGRAQRSLDGRRLRHRVGRRPARVRGRCDVRRPGWTPASTRAGGPSLLR